ncbi:M6 family metalloprotease domain-containing protein [Vibrio vulnificus]|uniref:M6 family metalloprotease domain-containing protein n=1 Tax=Vibrio vulnificus TaxID=672 RepID=UPI001CDC30D8|nr:M6 family metalloprotease domain-containing protein [Vibrio vulnificus]EJR3610166.1 M6 family metalloprotease domain-containing protein [Vibrio vulnificus]EJV9306768.1 M6 family metalloprotease domain-containing protein [Vibrio vulnificus]ELK2252317.1 M6 family metalloprotease domain-containing protein [Vibrio vulnificus]ELV8605373.1 M6 family metalloprotease domain-containing protein [Vibrio vulnificus]ELV8661783.1 M6 family metalloprotease domain-containing protein [Vibrio vulnificus]
MSLKIKKAKIGIAISSLLSSISLNATTLPSPDWHEFTMSDGSVREMRLMGNQALAWYQDREGTIYLYQGDTWYYGKYAEFDGEGRVVSTDVVVTQASQSPTASNSSLHPVKPARISFDEGYSSDINTTEHHAVALRIRQADQPVTQPLLVVQVSFNDEVMVNDFTNRIFGQDGQSVRDYFLKNSYNKYVVTPARETQGTANDGVINISLDMAHPDCHSKEDNTCNTRQRAIFTAAYAALDQYIDLSTYDSNGDGFIKPSELSVMFVFAGYDAAAGGNRRPYIWPHKFAHNNETIDGVAINAYCLFADFQGDHQSTMGVIAHELGHLMLGLPDLYSYEHDGSIGHWGLMGGGSWGRKPGDLYSGDTPVNMTAWSKEASGFLEPDVLNSNQSYTVNTSQGESVIYLDPYLQKMGPKLYLQNRRKVDYDRALQGEGLLATSVVIDNKFNSTGPMQVQIFQADGLDELNAGGWSDNGDVFPGSSNVTLLSDDSTPSLRLNTAGRNTGITISDIVSTNQHSTLTLQLPDQRGKHAWMTSFARQYTQYDRRINALGFAVDVHFENTSLDGIHFYAQKSDQTQPMEYKVTKYPYQTNWRGDVTFKAEDGVEIARGQLNSDGGRAMFPQPFALTQERHLIVVELTNAIPEFSTSYYDAYLSDGIRKEQFYADNATLQGGRMNSSRGRNFPFAALLQTQVNPLPQALDDQFQVTQGQSIQLNLMDNDTNLMPGHRFQVELMTQPSKGTVNGKEYQADLGAEGVDEFQYRLRDSDGNVSNTAKVSVTVLAINKPPVISAKVVNDVVYVGGLVELSVDKVEDEDSKAFSYQWQQISGPKVTLRNGQQKTSSFVVPEGVTASDVMQFKVTVTDDAQNEVSQNVEVTVNNHQPEAQNDHGQIKAGEVKRFRVLDNDIEKDGETLTLTRIVSQQGLGKASLSGNEIEFSAPATFGSETSTTVTYEIKDPQGLMSQATLIIQFVKPKTLVIDNITLEGREDESVILNLQQLAGKGGEVKIVELPKNGLIHNGQYVPQANFAGKDSFTFQVTNAEGTTSNIATVSINILPVNDLHTFSVKASKLQVSADERIELSVVQLKDIDSSNHQFNWKQVSGRKATILNADKSVAIVVIPSQSVGNEKLVFSATVRDEQGEAVTHSLTLTVHATTPSVKQGKLKLKFGSSLNVKPLESEYKGKFQLRITRPAEHGEVQIVNQELIYQAPSQTALTMIDRFNYEVLFDNGESKQGWFEIELSPTSAISGQNDDSDNPPTGDTGGEDAGSLGFGSAWLMAFVLLWRRRNS